MRIYRVLSRLLDYPDAELRESLPLINAIVEEESGLLEAERLALRALIVWMGERDLISLQECYVQTFDNVPEHSLHLTHHLFGDDRERGPALVDLAEFFKSEGLEPLAGELPDFLPLILEYVSTLDEFGAQVFLGDVVDVLAGLAENLGRAGSPYAPIVRIVERCGCLAGAPACVANPS